VQDFLDATKLLPSAVTKDPTGVEKDMGIPQSEFFLDFLKLQLSPYLNMLFFNLFHNV